MTPLLPWNAKDGKPLEVVNNVYGDAERRRRLSGPASSSWPPKVSGAIPAATGSGGFRSADRRAQESRRKPCQRKLTGKARLVAWAYSGTKFHACG